MKRQKPRVALKNVKTLAHPIPRLLSKIKRHTLSTNTPYSSKHYTEYSRGNLNYDTANLTAAARLTLLQSHRRVYGPTHHLTHPHCPAGCKAVQRTCLSVSVLYNLKLGISNLRNVYKKEME